MSGARPFRSRSLPLGGSKARGSEPACAGLDGLSARTVSGRAARRAEGAP